MGSGKQGGALELPPLLTDNRFLLGVMASAVGVLRSAYVVTVLFLQGHRGAAEINLPFRACWLTGCWSSTEIETRSGTSAAIKAEATPV